MYNNVQYITESLYKMLISVCSGVGKAAEDPEECGAGVSWVRGHPKLPGYSTMVIKPTRTFENI
jgi:hypothetical protein